MKSLQPTGAGCPRNSGACIAIERGIPILLYSLKLIKRSWFINVRISKTDAQRQSGQPSLLGLLRHATQEVHQRLHSHEGMGAIQDGTISRGNYYLMLRCLYGFHAAFENAVEAGFDRTNWLADDLLAMGASDESLALIPRCGALPALDTANQRLGASYVICGSALGGRELARGMDALLGVGTTLGRRFFIGNGPATGDVWRQYLALLADAPSDGQTQTEIVDAAVATFSAFEQWSAGWSESQ